MAAVLRKKRILLLSASAGSGHVRAAEALVGDFESHRAVESVEHWDILKYTNPVFRTLYSRVYLDLINRAPWLLGMVYKSTDKPWKNTVAQAFEKLNAAPFIEALRVYQPDVIVSTHFTPPNIISWLNSKKVSGRNVKIPAPAVVVTDLDCHAMWLTRSYSRYFVSLEETAIYLERMGIPADKITRSGIPIDPSFRTPKDKGATRAALGLDPRRFTVLVSAGGFGVGPMEALIEELQTVRGRVQIVAIAGKSAELKRGLDKLAKKNWSGADGMDGDGAILHVVGFTREMDAYMAAADILVSKPGGLTTAEAMARHLPMCIVNPIPGQEERNSDHLLEGGAAIKCNNPPTLAWKLEGLMNDAPRLAAMRAATKKFAHPDAGRTIVHSLLDGL